VQNLAFILALKSNVANCGWENFKMVLHKLKDFDPNYRNTFEDGDIVGMSVYTERTDEKIGSIADILVDDAGHFRYFVVDLGFWIFGKKVLMPVGRSRIDHGADRVYVMGLSKEQAEDLPEYHSDMVTDYDYEERVRGVYRPGAATSASAVNTSIPLEASAPLESTVPLEAERSMAMDSERRTDMVADTTLSTPAVTAYDRDTYDYHHEPALYEMNEADHRTFKLYEERLVANKTRMKTGEVSIGKHVETETQTIAVPVEKERIVVERTIPTDTTVNPIAGETAFQEGEVARLEVYEETPDIRKEAYVAEEVKVHKEVDQETVQAAETLRKERLDIDTEGNPRVGQ
jgi:uncharacterized protein (TIGR02271 family)